MHKVSKTQRCIKENAQVGENCLDSRANWIDSTTHNLKGGESVREGRGRYKMGGGREKGWGWGIKGKIEREREGEGERSYLVNFSTYTPLRGSDRFLSRVSEETGGLRICRAVLNPVKFINKC